MSMKKIIVFVLALFAVFIVVAFLTVDKSHAPAKISNEQSATTSNTQHTDKKIVVTAPKEGESISSPVIVTGEARGTWFFEGSFPVELQDRDGKSLAQGIAKAQGDWMTEDFVPFSASLSFEKPATASEGKLLFKKDNPSGLPENDDSIEINVMLKDKSEPTKPTVTLNPNARAFFVQAVNYSFSLKEIVVQQGDTVTINFESTDGFHDWVLDEFNARTKQVSPNKPTSVTFVADKAGTFEYYCSVGNHRAHGMVGTLIVKG